MRVEARNEVLSLRNVAIAIIGMTVASKISIPLYPVPITTQMFALYLINLILSPKEAFASILGWLSFGAVGFPVFASSVGGIAGPSAGYLIGMIVASSILGFIRGKVSSSLFLCIICYLIVHIFGCLWLSSYVSVGEVVSLGIIPFIIPEFFKITAAIAIYKNIRL